MWAMRGGATAWAALLRGLPCAGSCRARGRRRSLDRADAGDPFDSPARQNNGLRPGASRSAAQARAAQPGGVHCGDDRLRRPGRRGLRRLARARTQQAQAQSLRRESMARRELDLYAKALETFYADFDRYPTATEGLAALVRQPSSLAGWRGPYIEGDYSVDPWGADYVYHVFNDGKGYILSTYGPEGESSGRAFLQVHSGASGSIESGRSFRAR